MSLSVLENEIYAVSMVKFFKEGRTIEDDCASGFFFRECDQFYFITNRHVVIDEKDNHVPEQLRLCLHTNINDLTKNATFKLQLYDKNGRRWLEHPIFGREIDVIALPICKEEISDFCILPFSRFDFHASRYLHLGDELLVVGYPEGNRDTLHNTPIARAATIATLFNQPFLGKPGFLIDSRLHNGTSGSPVLTKPTTIVRDLGGKVSLIQDRKKSFKKYLIGVHSEKFDMKYPELDLSFVWSASLIPEIIETDVKMRTSRKD